MAVRVKAVPRMVASSFLACATSGSCLRCALVMTNLVDFVSGVRGAARRRDSRGRAVGGIKHPLR